ncbi:MAG: SAM-dependent methyltransferase [Nitrospiraceae bacterium]|nr:SAM-dependent methyltransferase [Nitrospiraceae bacterium]
MSLVHNPLLQLTGPQQHLWNDFEALFPSEAELVLAAVALGAGDIAPWSTQETTLARSAQKALPISKQKLGTLRDLIRCGYDPLGEAFCALRSAPLRRESGATYTPGPIVRTMMEWAADHKNPGRIIDPGTGSARFLMQAGETFPEADLIGVDLDPLAALIARANLAVMGLAKRTRIILGDYRTLNEPSSKTTLYIGNPPYVRHHQISTKWKEWLSELAESHGHKASQLAGLHVHFFLATAMRAQRGDFGAFITAAEWLDVNYGSLVRALLLKELGGHSITVIEPTAQPFPDAATTAAITTFEIGSKPTSVFFRRVDSLRELNTLTNGRKIHRDRLTAESRWSHLTRAAEKPPEGYVELGELCRVHRGQVTGSNEVWIAGEHSDGLPDSVLYPTVTRARELFEAEGVLKDASKLKCVIDLPIELDELNAADRRAVARFLTVAKQMGGNKGYVASHRKAWWAVGLRMPAPIISTYMARRPPAFVLNKADARHINIAHGLYPRDPLSAEAKKNLIGFLQTNISQRSGRTYAGGLTKFEPREMERLIVPGPAMLAVGVIG